MSQPDPIILRPAVRDDGTLDLVDVATGQSVYALLGRIVSVETRQHVNEGDKAIITVHLGNAAGGRTMSVRSFDPTLNP